MSSRNWSVPGLGGPGSGASRASLAALEDAALEDALVEMCLALREGGAERWVPLANAAALPLAEVVASPFGLRAVALGVESGATSVHREVRALLPWPAPLPVGDPRHGSWFAGNLRIGKYQAFQADAPLAVFDPAHIAKWGPHELMHRAVGFFHRADMTRWEHYLGARLNEVLPVVLWYGPDQVVRLDEEDFEREDAGTHPRAELSDVRWLREPADALRLRLRRALPRLRRGLLHFATELAAVDEELRRGTPVSTVHRFGAARLDPSSDALAYVVGHHDRVVDPALAQVIAEHAARLHALGGSPVHFDSIEAYREHIVERFDSLLFADLEIDPARVASRREVRVAWDLAVRRLRVLSAEDADDGTPVVSRERAERQGLVDADAGDLRALDCEQLMHGFEATVPATFRTLGEGQVLAFLRSPEFFERGTLDERLARFLDGVDEVLSGLARFESRLVHAAADDAVEVLGEDLPELPRAGLFFRAERFSLVSTRGDVARVHPELLAGPVARPWPEEDLEHHFLVGLAPAPHEAIGGEESPIETHEVAVLPASVPLGELWERLGAGALAVPDVWDFLTEAYGEEGAEAYVEALLATGALGWRPR